MLNGLRDSKPSGLMVPSPPPSQNSPFLPYEGMAARWAPGSTLQMTLAFPLRGGALPNTTTTRCRWGASPVNLECHRLDHGIGQLNLSSSSAFTKFMTFLVV